jgi:serine phosphatase RsbU (regulator of sigma subunit)
VYAARRLPLEAACERLLETALAFGASCEPQDDLTLLALEVTGGAGTLPT